MAVISEVQIIVATNDPSEVVRGCIKLLRSHTTSLARLEIGLRLICDTHRELLQHLGERLPSAALGFGNTLSSRALTAAQFRALPDSCFTFQGILTQHFEPSKALLVIEELLGSPHGSIRGAEFNLDVEEIHWNGAPLDSAGSLFLSDLKSFKRGKRFSLTARLRVPGENPKAPEVIRVLEQVAQATGIAFDQGRVARVLGENSPELAKAELVGQICFDEAVENVAAHLPDHFLSEFASKALPYKQGQEQRFDQRQWGSPGKVDLASVIKRAVKELVPELEFESDSDSCQLCTGAFYAGIPPQIRAVWILFRKHLDCASEIVVIFSKTMLALGKAFNLSLGIRSVENGMVFYTNVFQFERTGARKLWIYSDIIEAREVVREAVGLAKGLLPRFESSIRPYFAVWPRKLPDGIEQHGSLTARQAFKKAQTVASNQWPDATLIQISNHSRSSRSSRIEGPDLSIDGRLTNNAEWRCNFYSAQGDVILEMTVPYFGSVRILNICDGLNPCRFAPVGEGWMDSDQALALAEDRGGRERRGSGRVIVIATYLQMSAQERPYWRIRYGVNDERGRNDLEVLLDAVNGEAFNTAVPWRRDLEGF